MDLLLENHPFTDSLALVRLGHVIGLNDLNQSLFAIHPDAPALVDVVGSKLKWHHVDRAILGGRSGKGIHIGNLDRLPLDVSL